MFSEMVRFAGGQRINCQRRADVLGNALVEEGAVITKRPARGLRRCGAK